MSTPILAVWAPHSSNLFILSAVTSKGGQSFWIKVNGQKPAAKILDHNLRGSRCKLGVRRGGCSTGTRLLPLMQHRRKVRESIELRISRTCTAHTVFKFCATLQLYRTLTSV